MLMHQARLLIINSDSWNAPISLHPPCGNHAQELPHAVPGDEEIAVHSGGPEVPGAPTINEEVVMTPRPRVAMRADGPRRRAREGSVQEGPSLERAWSHDSITTRATSESRWNV